MSVLVTSKFDKDLIKSEHASVETLFIPLLSLWDIFKTLEGNLLRREWSDLAEI